MAQRKVVPFDYLWNITRASSKYVWQRVNGSMQLVEIPANERAITYDPLTGIPLGLSVEGSATNLVEQSHNLLDAYWSVTSASISVGGTGSLIDGLQPHRINESSDSFTHDVRASITVSNVSYSVSAYAKADGRNIISFGGMGLYGSGENVQFDLLNGVAYSTGTGNATASIESVGDGWYRCSMGWTPPSGATSLVLQMRNAIQSGPPDGAAGTAYTGDGVSGVFIAQVDVVAGSKPTSPIITTGTTATRDADIVTSDAATFGDWFNASEGTFVVEFNVTEFFADARYIIWLSNSVNGDVLLLRLLSDGVRFVLYNTAGSIIVAQTLTEKAIVGSNRLEFSFENSVGLSASLNGAATQSFSFGSNIKVADSMTIGSRADNDFLDGNVKLLSFEPEATL